MKLIKFITYANSKYASQMSPDDDKNIEMFLNGQSCHLLIDTYDIIHNLAKFSWQHWQLKKKSRKLQFNPHEILKHVFLISGARLKKVIITLEESLANKTQEAQHLSELVAKMESSSSSDEMNKVQIADLKTELAKAEDALRIRTEELLDSKKEMRVKDEEIQQREIDISCLRGQVESLLNLVDEDEDTLTLENIDSDADDDVLLEDLEWDNNDCEIKVEKS